MSLKVEHLHFSYDQKRQVLKDINFEIEDGKLVCLLGPNGVGKSTLFKTILRLLPGYEGKIYLDGQDTSSLSVKDMARLVAYIPQSHEPTFNYTVYEMVLMGTTVGLSTFSSPGRRQKELVDEKLEMLGITKLRNRGFAQISGGERQLALIARALVQETKVLIMDEPTANLDYGNTIRVLEQIKGLTGSGYTILQATHQPDQAFLFADEVLAISQGTVLAKGNPKDVITPSFVDTLYQVKVDIQSLYNDEIRVCVPTFGKNGRNTQGGDVGI
ncbi:ABC transporter ATP-binding protein [Eubacterium oxidoreducens]|uniref:Iron complex transport system ATP-binding protein n=1 Tax=Eubacterium oxidoreducens TaxID=1732 RepID=A0A1G6BGN7_EUBOX|nr:ABC transporter ATP-binding protein [Eubacterium oxidoreducens]SDB19776.1 iron complex transport system ATP-binding protein [Eubacterium oxidoreducens]